MISEERAFRVKACWGAKVVASRGFYRVQIPDDWTDEKTESFIKELGEEGHDGTDSTTTDRG